MIIDYICIYDVYLYNSSETNPFDANGAGSVPLRENLSASDAKQRSAPSATCASSCRSNTDRASTQSGKALSWGSTLPHNRVTTAMAECNVSRCTRAPCSRMKHSAQGRPPASNTAPASLAHTSSNT